MEEEKSDGYVSLSPSLPHVIEASLSEPDFTRLKPSLGRVALSRLGWLVPESEKPQ